MLIAKHGMKLYALCYTRSEAIFSLLYIECSFIHEMKRHALCYTWSEALCSMLYKE